MGPGREQLRLGWVVEPAGYFGDREVVVGILNGAGAGALIGKCDVAFGVIVQDAAPALLLCVGRRNGGILQHRFKGGLIVDARESFDVRIADDDVGVAAALGAAVVIATAGIGHITGVAVDVDEGADEVALPVRRDECEQRPGAAIRVPYGVVVVVVRLGRFPAGVLACAIRRHQHGVVHGGVELNEF